MPRGRPSRRRVAVRRHAPSFFERDAPPVKKAPQRPDADAEAARLQLLLKLDERDVRRLGDLAKEKGSFGFYATLPCFFSRSSQLLVLDALTPNRSADLAARKTMFNGIRQFIERCL